MRIEEIHKILLAQKYYIFSLGDICAFFPDEKITTIKQGVSRWKKKGFIVALKKGLYEFTYPIRQEIPDMYISHKLYSPSYVSLETALSYYNIIPEFAVAVTSVTTMPTRRFRNDHGLFLFHSIQPRAFRGYVIEKQSGFDVLVAEPEKALIDFLYFKTRVNSIAFDFAAERFDKKRIQRLNKNKLDGYGRLYNLDLKRILYAYL